MYEDVKIGDKFKVVVSTYNNLQITIQKVVHVTKKRFKLNGGHTYRKENGWIVGNKDSFSKESIYKIKNKEEEEEIKEEIYIDRLKRDWERIERLINIPIERLEKLIKLKKGGYFDD